MVIVRSTDKSNALKISVAAAIFCALAYASEYVFHVKVMFLTFDIKDSIIAVAAMIFGPLSAVFMSVSVSLIEMVTISDTLHYGFIMNVLSTLSLSVTASVIYKYKRNMLGAVIGLVSGVFAVTAVMMLANILITPYYMGVERSVVVSYIPTLLLPFNFTKATLNASITLLIYKPIITAMRRAGVIRSAGNYKPGKKMVIVTVIAAVVIVISLIVFFKVLGAEIKWFQPKG